MSQYSPTRIVHAYLETDISKLLVDTANGRFNGLLDSVAHCVCAGLYEKE